MERDKNIQSSELSSCSGMYNLNTWNIDVEKQFSIEASKTNFAYLVITSITNLFLIHEDIYVECTVNLTNECQQSFLFLFFGQVLYINNQRKGRLIKWLFVKDEHYYEKVV